MYKNEIRIALSAFILANPTMLATQIAKEMEVPYGVVRRMIWRLKKLGYSIGTYQLISEKSKDIAAFIKEQGTNFTLDLIAKKFNTTRQWVGVIEKCLREDKEIDYMRGPHNRRRNPSLDEAFAKKRQEREDFFREHYGQMECKEMAEKLSMRVENVWSYIRRMRKKGLFPPKGRKGKVVEYLKYVLAMHGKISNQEIADHLGVHLSRISQLKKILREEWGVDLPEYKLSRRPKKQK